MTPGGWGSILLLGLGGLWIVWDWLKKVLHRCPECKQWFAGVIYDRDSNSYTDYATKTFTDEHRDATEG